MKIIFASNNQHKVEEIRSVIGYKFEILSLKEAGIDIDIPEPHNTLEENASEKSRTIYSLTKTDCFSEDTGLEVAALNGEPGVKSARYAGEAKSSEDNIDKLLQNLADSSNRKARFRTIISLIVAGDETLFEGIAEGQIITTKTGSFGFGYDAVFIPDGATQTFAEMSIIEKNIYSHRRKATEKLVSFLNELESKPRN